MNEELYAIVYAKLIDSGHSVDSSASLAMHLALHYPSHARALMALTATEVCDDADQEAPRA